jgi:hypothetical protein
MPPPADLLPVLFLTEREAVCGKKDLSAEIEICDAIGLPGMTIQISSPKNRSLSAGEHA